MLAKTLVIAGTAFVVGIVGALVSYVLAQLILEPHGSELPAHR